MIEFETIEGIKVVINKNFIKYIQSNREGDYTLYILEGSPKEIDEYNFDKIIYQFNELG